MVEHHLLLCALDDLLLDAGLGDEAVHVHLLLLPDPVGAGLRLNHTRNTNVWNFNVVDSVADPDPNPDLDPSNIKQK
jgi:hypothetical protein